ncbi:MAG: UvrD-helicase domain-containing protein [Ignavibacteriaceae bacterium]|nr:UvrD-helicase domain-containing protein [Ignavibacteriaceae bacterium]
MDFEDLLLKSVDLFKSKKIVSKYKKIFTNILIDDFQDINKPQYEILSSLSAKTDPVVVFVDENQSIFNWRGADPSKIEQFATDYSKVKVFTLENSFRVNSNILMGAYSVVKNNEPGNSVVAGSLIQDGKKISIIRSADEKDEAYHLARFIKDEIAENKYSFDDFAILFRTQAQARTFEDVFQTEAIPFRIIGGVEYYKKKEIKDIIAYLKIFLNQHDEESLLRIMNFPQRGIGMTTVKRMLQFSERHEINLFDTMGRVFEVIDIKERIQKNVKSFKMLLDKFILLKDKLSVEELTRALLDELEIFKLLNEEANFESLEKKQNVEELLQSISIFCKNNPNLKLEDYLQTVCLMADIEKLDDSSNKVTLMTAHSSKGLEFPVIFVSGLEEDLFPLAQKFSAETSIEEERRLFYTCVTRAKDKVYLSHARSRYRFGEVAYQNRSRFIDEIDAEYAYDEDMSGNRKNNRRTKKEVYLEIFREMEYNNSAPQSIKVGARVLHEKFGLGKVVNIVGAGENQKVTVVFEGNLTKQLMLKYAKLKVHNA